MKADTRRLLEAVQRREVDVEDALLQLRNSFFEPVGRHSLVDHDRPARVGTPEVIFGAGKTVEQVAEIAGAMVDRGEPVLVTRATPAMGEELMKRFAQCRFDPLSGVVTVGQAAAAATETFIGLVSAGTSDMKVAEEARLTAEFYGNRVETFYDCGVAGLHRMLAQLSRLREARVLVVVAGMEGALPSVVGGQVACPVIAVPTSVGYGANFGGLAALLGMLNTCASGVSVVNIDNGFGAGYLASMINRM